MNVVQDPIPLNQMTDEEAVKALAELTSQVERAWSYESLADKILQSPEFDICEEDFFETTKYMPGPRFGKYLSGRYQLPFKKWVHRESLGNTVPPAIQRFYNLETIHQRR